MSSQMSEKQKSGHRRCVLDACGGACGCVYDHNLMVIVLQPQKTSNAKNVFCLQNVTLATDPTDKSFGKTANPFDPRNGFGS